MLISCLIILDQKNRGKDEPVDGKNKKERDQIIFLRVCSEHDEPIYGKMRQFIIQNKTINLNFFIWLSIN